MTICACLVLVNHSAIENLLAECAIEALVISGRSRPQVDNACGIYNAPRTEQQDRHQWGPIRMFLNYQLPPLASFSETRTRSFAEIADGIHVSLEEDLGEIAVLSEDVLKIEFSDISPEAGWMELGIQLADARWKSCSRLVLRVDARSGSGEARINPALRIRRGDEFLDRFAVEKLTVGPDLASCTTEFDLAPKDVHDAESIALFLFFESADEELELTQLSLCGLA